MHWTLDIFHDMAYYELRHEKTRSDTYWPVQSQKKARSLKLWQQQEKRYRSPSLSRNQGEWRKHFEFSEVRDKQIESKKLNSLTFSDRVFSTMFTPSIVNFFVFCFRTLHHFANVENADPKIDFLFSTSLFSFFFVDHEVPPMSFDFEVRHRKGETNTVFSDGSKLALRHRRVLVITEFDTSKVEIQKHIGRDAQE